MDGSIRVDIGAGHVRQKGWISVDHVDSQLGKPDVDADITKLPFPDGYADQARAIHVIEHFYAWEALGVMMEWARILKPGGELAVECPCLEKVIKLFEVPQIDPRYTFWACYGDPRHQRPDMCHRWIYSTLSLSRLMMQAGLENVHAEPPQFHFPVRDMRVVGRKPAPSSGIVLPQ